MSERFPVGAVFRKRAVVLDRHPAQPWLTFKTLPFVLQPPWYCVTLAGATISGDQCCRPAESPAGLNGAENRKKKEANRVSACWEPYPHPQRQQSSLQLPALLLPPHIFTFTEHSSALAYFLCTSRMFVSLHMLIKRKGQHGFKEKGLLLVWGEQQSWRRGSDCLDELISELMEILLQYFQILK